MEQIKSLIEGHNLTTVRVLEEIRKNGYTGGYTILKDTAMIILSFLIFTQ